MRKFMILFLFSLMVTPQPTSIVNEKSSAQPSPSAYTSTITAPPEYAEFNLGEHSTTFNIKSKGRANNIKKSAQSIDERIIMPGETFSFNEAVGPTVKRRGYLEARIFVDGKDSKGYGGGVCQTSSTLYNAVLKAGLKVTERHPHSKSVEYVEKDKDAATSYGDIDFKFENNMPVPIKILAKTNEDKLQVSIMALIEYVQ